MQRDVRPLIIGSGEDPHVRAVFEAIAGKAIVFDVEQLQRITFDFRPPYIQLRSKEHIADIGLGVRGWIRRLSPIAWEAGTEIGSHNAVGKASWLSLLAAILRHPDIEWLSQLDDVNAAENKLTQYTLASGLGIRIPVTIVSNDPSSFAGLATPLIAKPLGPGHYQDTEGRWLTVFTEPFEPRDQGDLSLLQGPPFIVQERIRARAHLRIVTVHERAWVFRLDAEGLPPDWREVRRAHGDWAHVSDDGVGAQAITIAAAHNLGYSSQDWIESDNDHIFLDLNPSGQWLFLPEAGSQEITSAIADWLREPFA